MRLLRRIWRMLRSAAGEDAYARFCDHLRRNHPERPLPSEKEFYLAFLEDKYSKPSRCC